MAASSSSTAPATTQPPVTIVCIGMAGSGKTTFMQRINAHLHSKHLESPSTTSPPYLLNLDPAVRSVPFEPNIDIRDSVNYKEVMKQYNLGPNGAILTSLNLFSTKIDQVMGILEKRCLPSQPSQPPSQTSASQPPPAAEASSTRPPQHILLDTPGQIEVFVWSASGSILLSALASTFPTVLAYIIDTPRTTANTATFMSNMLYAISILYKTQLPMILVFNKTDVVDEAEAVEWMRDFESFQAALRKEEENNEGGGGGGGGGYMGSLLNSMSLVLEEFYNHLSVVGVSSMTGEGVDGFFSAVEEKRAEFERDYRPEMERRKKEAESRKEKAREKEVARMMGDMGVSSRAKGTGKYARKTADGRRGGMEEPETVSEAEEMEEDEDEGLVDPDSEEEGGEVEEKEGFDEEGLKERYKQALRDSGGTAAGTGPRNGGVGMAANYIRRSQR